MQQHEEFDKKMQFKFSKTLGSGVNAFRLDASADIVEGRFIGIYGASGAGKTTLLRLLAGLEKPEQGMLVVEEDTWVDTSRHLFLPPQQRSIGYVFQEYALFPNMTIRKNLDYAAKPAVLTDRIHTLLQVTNLYDIADKYPAELSGGQQQRAALARALVRSPKLLLLDEPLSALDEGRREELQHFLKKIHTDFHLTTVLVSHNISELAKLCDYVIEMEKGRVKQAGPPSLLFKKQQTIDLVNQKVTVLAIIKKNGQLVAEIAAGHHKITMTLDPQKYAGIRAGDVIQVKS